VDEPVDASDDEGTFIMGPYGKGTGHMSITFKWMDDEPGYTCLNELSSYSWVYSAVARIRMRVSDIFNTGNTLQTDHDVFGIDQFSIHVDAAPNTNQCDSAGWKTYEHQLNISPGGLSDSYFNDATWNIDLPLNKQQRLMISAMEVCVTSGILRSTGNLYP